MNVVSKNNYFLVPEARIEAPEYENLFNELSGCDPSLRNIATVGLSAIAYAARERPDLLATPILGDGVGHVIHPNFTHWAQEEYDDNDNNLALSGAAVVAATAAASRLLKSSGASSHQSYSGEVPVSMSSLIRQAELPIAEASARLEASQLLGRMNVRSVAVRIYDSLGGRSGNESLYLAATSSPDPFCGQESYFVSLTSSHSRRGNEPSAEVQMRSGDISGPFAMMQEREGFNRLNELTALMSLAVSSS